MKNFIVMFAQNNWREEDRAAKVIFGDPLFGTIATAWPLVKARWNRIRLYSEGGGRGERSYAGGLLLLPQESLRQ